MITNLLIAAFAAVVYILTLPLRVVDPVSPISSMGAALTSAGHYLAPFNLFLPLSEILTVLSIVTSIEAAYLTYKGIMWIVRKIPTIS